MFTLKMFKKKRLKRAFNIFLYQQTFNTNDVAVGGRSRVPKKISLNCTKLNNQLR